MNRSLNLAIIGSMFVAVTAALIYVFYATELRSRTEDELYDLRTRMAPAIKPRSPVFMLTIDDDNTTAIDAKIAPTPWDTAYPSENTAAILYKVVNAVAATNARMIAVVLPPQFVSYDDSDLDRLAALAQADKRVVIGTFGLSMATDDDHVNASRLMLTANDRLAKADIKRNFRRETIRRLVFFEPNEMPYLSFDILQKLAPNQATSLLTSDMIDKTSARSAIDINYAYKDEIMELPAPFVVSNPGQIDLSNAIVLIGYTAFRPFTFDDREATYVNTPWQPDGDDVINGIPLVKLQAIGLLNLLEDTWLKPAPVWVNAVQTAVAAALALVAWALNISTACLVFVGGWILILVAHAFVFSYLHIHLPLADTVLWASMATLGGAFWRLRGDIQQRATQMEKLRSDAELVRVQDQFLSRFAAELLKLNARLSDVLRSLVGSVTGTAATALDKALASANELRDYLVGMRQVGYLNRMDQAKPPLTKVAVGEVIVEVLRLFETKAQQAKVTFEVSLTPEATAMGDKTLIAQILYNLVGNAIKYSPRDGQIIIEAIRVKRDILMRVTDQGPGIAPEYHGRIFEKFYRIKDDFVYKSKGHGLGLYLSRYFAKQMGAEISLESTPGAGATFTLRLLAAMKESG